MFADFDTGEPGTVIQLYPELIPAARPVVENDVALLHTGPLNRLSLSLESQLPNEMSWSLTKLARISFNFGIDIAGVPFLLDNIVDHAMDRMRPLAAGSIADRALYELSQALEEDSSTPKTTDFATLFSNANTAADLHDILLPLHVLRNLSTLDANAVYMAKSRHVLRLLALGLSLQTVNWSLSEISEHCMDILSNCSSYILLGYQGNPFLSGVIRFLSSPSRQSVVAALNSLQNLLGNDANASLFTAKGILEDSKFHRQLCDLAMSQGDDELAYFALEVLTQLASLHSDVGVEVVANAPAGFIGMLVTMLGRGWKFGESWGTRSLGSDFRVNNSRAPQGGLFGGEPQALRPTMSTNHLKAHQWLLTNVTSAPHGSIPLSDMYQEYASFCQLQGAQSINLRDLVALAVNSFAAAAEAFDEKGAESHNVHTLIDSLPALLLPSKHLVHAGFKVEG
ncbi:hypothetical protein M427DRAFT_380753 [Gonapodya prolifera JEL478]|uniref:Uncharacterized protein n=1 Tax=Gonapodya prolifera (strain JEL478) TaxID=1344416 RepID=A0A139AVR5_GONPJ|nr:hypothetical protein M427DRAFT_380753 [Gonapodya prolifera JEL478]|eukprot:KXS20673.1 hypothetical protein M427DRAFT_380753 [Gonapodya prolifera JEL478]